LGPFEPVLWSGATRLPLHRQAISHLLHGNLRPETPVKNWMAIKRSDRKLGPFRTGSLVCSDETSTSPTSDSTSTTQKPAFENCCKHLMAINCRIKSKGPFEPVLWSGATRLPLHRQAIPHLLHGNLCPETPAKI